MGTAPENISSPNDKFVPVGMDKGANGMLKEDDFSESAFIKRNLVDLGVPNQDIFIESLTYCIENTDKYYSLKPGYKPCMYEYYTVLEERR
jgi:hypothetical protein